MIIVQIKHAAQTDFQNSPFFIVGQLAQVGAFKSLTVFNGSSRGRSGNTPSLFQKVIDGFTSVDGNAVQMLHLFQTKKKPHSRKAFEKADSVLISFPFIYRWDAWDCQGIY